MPPLVVRTVTIAGAFALAVSWSAAAVADAPSPAICWRLPYPAWGEPAADGTAAYFLTQDHEVVAVDRKRGVVAWRHRTGGTGDVPAGSMVRVAGPLIVAGDDAIVAFDRLTGREAWRYTAPDDDAAGVFLGHADQRVVLAGSPMGRLYVIDAETGSLRWMRELARGERRVVYPPVEAAGRVVAAFTTFDGPIAGGLAAFDGRGRRLWVHAFGPGVGAGGAPVSVGHTVFVARTDGIVEAVAASTGRVQWRLPAVQPAGADGALRRDIRALTRSGPLLVASSLNGEIRAYDAGTRRERWRFADGPLDAVALRLSADASSTYVPYTDGSLVALDAHTGRVRWRIAPVHGSFDWPPAAFDGAIFASGSDAIIEARGADEGHDGGHLICPCLHGGTAQ